MYRNIYKHSMHHPMSSGEVSDLLHQLSRTVNADIWEDNSQIQDIMFVTPDRQFAWLFRIEPTGGMFPSSANSNGCYKSTFYVRNVSSCNTISECLQGFGITVQDGCGFQVLNDNGELIDPAQAPVQAIILKSKTRS